MLLFDIMLKFCVRKREREKTNKVDEEEHKKKTKNTNKKQFLKYDFVRRKSNAYMY